MVDKLRLATTAEIERIKLGSDLDSRVPITVVAFENGTAEPDLAVVKTVVELDPVFFQPFTTDKRKVLFMWALTNAIRLQGVPVVYFNAPIADETWLKNVESFGGEQISTGPEYRFKLELTKLE